MLAGVVMRALVEILAFHILLLPHIFAAPSDGVWERSNIQERQSDPQTSLTLDPSQVQTALEQSGLNASDPTITASLTSGNNFINWCMTQTGVPLTNGTQNPGGSCNPVPMGRVLAKDKIPSAKFKYPKNGSLVPSNTTFTVQLVVRNFETGYFSNSETNWLAAPQTVNDQGLLRGHSHIVIERVQNYLSEDPLDPLGFTFFKAMNIQASNNVLTVTVTGGIPPGIYRISSINTAVNHQAPVISIAQRGAVDDMVYFRASPSALAKRNTDDSSPFV